MDVLERILKQDAANMRSQHNLGRNIIPSLLAEGGKLQAYTLANPVPGQPAFWRDISNIDDYYEANMDLLRLDEDGIDLYHPSWPFRTYQEQLPPARLTGDGESRIMNCIISGGCMINRSRLENSILFSDVTLHEDCELKGVLALPGTHIGAGSRLANVILDNRSIIKPGTVIGEDNASDHRSYRITDRGRALISTAKSLVA
jgi:glucose-1-phosphate adenylyltransferase